MAVRGSRWPWPGAWCVWPGAWESIQCGGSTEMPILLVHAGSWGVGVAHVCVWARRGASPSHLVTTPTWQGQCPPGAQTWGPMFWVPMSMFLEDVSMEV